MTKKESMENGDDITAWKVKPFINPRPSNRLPVYTRADSNLLLIDVTLTFLIEGGGVAEHITSSKETLKTILLGTCPSTGIKLMNEII